METEFLFENQNLVVFRDINPHAPVHLLIVPKRHIRSVNDLTPADDDILAEMITTARQMAQKEKVDVSGYKLLFNVEKGGGQVIFHLHLHLMGGCAMGSDPQQSANNRFYCYTESCGSPEKGLFFIDLPGEAVMDKNNLATIFCPKCGKTMKPLDPDSGDAVNL